MKRPFAFLVMFLTAVAGCASAGKPMVTRSGLVYIIVEQGSGPAARIGQYVHIHETATFTDGRLLYSTRTAREQLRFLLGGKQAIDGADEGVTGMRVGERRQMIVPPELSRRKTYPEGLSPKATLHYDVELVGIKPEQAMMAFAVHLLYLFVVYLLDNVDYNRTPQVVIPKHLPKFLYSIWGRFLKE